MSQHLGAVEGYDVEVRETQRGTFIEVGNPADENGVSLTAEGFEKLVALVRGRDVVGPKCWRCDQAANGRPNAVAILTVVVNPAGSYSGTFDLPLCYSCSLTPHNEGLKRIL